MTVRCQPARPPVVVSPPKLSTQPRPVTLHDNEVAAALTQYIFSAPKSKERGSLALSLVEHMLLRAQELFKIQQDGRGLAAIRFAMILVRAHQIDPTLLSDEAITVFDLAVNKPALYGEEGTALGLYMFWSKARPQATQPQKHLNALQAWLAYKHPSLLVNLQRDAVRYSEQISYLPTPIDYKTHDDAIVRWIEQSVALRDAVKNEAHTSEEIYSAAMGINTAGWRLLATHMRDGDIEGAVQIFSQPHMRNSLPELVYRVLLAAGPTPSVEGYLQVLNVLVSATKTESVDVFAFDAMFGVTLHAMHAYSTNMYLADPLAEILNMLGFGDAVPLIFSRVLLGTGEKAQEHDVRALQYALLSLHKVINNYASYGQIKLARQTFEFASPLITAAQQTSRLSKEIAVLYNAMGHLESQEAGRHNEARSFYQQALRLQPLFAHALIGVARLDAYAGNLSMARRSLENVLLLTELVRDPLLYSSALILAADYARRDNDTAAAHTYYRQALFALSRDRLNAKGGVAAEINYRTALIYSRFDEGSMQEENAFTAVEHIASSLSGNSRFKKFVLNRFARAFFRIDPTLALAALKKVKAFSPPQEYVIEGACISYWIAKKTTQLPQQEMVDILDSARSKDDFSGKLAQFTLGKIDSATLFKQSNTPYQLQVARFLVLLSRWAQEPNFNKKDIRNFLSSALVGDVESEIAFELLNPTRTFLTMPRIKRAP